MGAMVSPPHCVTRAAFISNREHPKSPLWHQKNPHFKHIKKIIAKPPRFVLQSVFLVYGISCGKRGVGANRDVSLETWDTHIRASRWYCLPKGGPLAALYRTTSGMPGFFAHLAHHNLQKYPSSQQKHTSPAMQYNTGVPDLHNSQAQIPAFLRCIK